MPPPPPPPQLMDELVEEILLRLPPDSPASLVRAGLVCKRWCHLVSDPGFRRRFREHHRSPPVLGLLISARDGSGDDDGKAYTYIHTNSFVPKPGYGLRGVDHPALRPRECRHGRVLLYSYHRHDTVAIVVWDPITGEQVQLPDPPPLFLFDPITGERWPELPNPPPSPSVFASTWTATVLCAAAAGGGTCDHLDCHGGPFIVVLVAQYTCDHPISSYVYSSESGAWSQPTFSPCSGGWCWFSWQNSNSLLVGNALHFVLYMGNTEVSILQYDLLGTSGKKITAIDVPRAARMRMDRVWTWIELVATKDDGRLGFVAVEDKTKLSLWSREEVGGRWALCQVIDLDKLIPMDALRPRGPYHLSGSTEGTGVIFLRVGVVGLWRLVAIDLWSGLVAEEVDELKPSYFAHVIPYASFFTPVLSRSPCTDGGLVEQERVPQVLEGSSFLERKVTRLAI